MIKKISILLVLVFTSAFINAQELDCIVNINSDRIEGTNKQRFETLKASITEFLNTRVWTDQSYETQEKIEANINIILMQEIASDQFVATIEVQSRRPVYGSDYYTNLFNFKDNNFQFRYAEFQPLIYNEQVFSSNLVSVLAYYANLIIGLDKDSFQNKGGTMYFENARKIVEVTQNQGYSGWEVSTNRVNRYWIIENILSPNYESAREEFYNYHIKGLDIMHMDVEEGRLAIFNSIKFLSKINTNTPNQNYLQNFMNAKSDEIFDIFNGADDIDKKELKEYLNSLSPTNQNRWDKI
jgi:hypothetical protein